MSFNTNSPDFSNNSNSKAMAQRHYREKEGEGFAELQMAIHDVTGGRDDPDKRHDILTKGKSDHPFNKIRELHRHNIELRQQLTMSSGPSFGAPGGQGPGAGSGGVAATHHAHGFGVSAWGNASNTHSTQHYGVQHSNLTQNQNRGYPGPSRHVYPLYLVFNFLENHWIVWHEWSRYGSDSDTKKEGSACSVATALSSVDTACLAGKDGRPENARNSWILKLETLMSYVHVHSHVARETYVRTERNTVYRKPPGKIPLTLGLSGATRRTDVGSSPNPGKRQEVIMITELPKRSIMAALFAYKYVGGS
ncbi:hypothetical protein K503DRAFT_784727 [Rhizopogon vinicolor AM-OR11-026]|uniref:Uncharacterized protein n=1 Tax=Rhizopogon vinicolor AM-OR11-026 TaxID=1314800 RepID=A0A1B7MTJ0_9AGAM|nr:hypothetical protein K503DRAFT_784727 [Rhizopogon vinicolor AM-OR11-026]